MELKTIKRQKKRMFGATTSLYLMYPMYVRGMNARLTYNVNYKKLNTRIVPIHIITTNTSV